MTDSNVHRFPGVGPSSAPWGTGLAGAGEPPHDGGMEGRVAALEQIARNTEKVLDRMDARMSRMEDRQISDFRWLLGLGITATGFLLAADAGIFAVLAHGFGWL